MRPRPASPIAPPRAGTAGLGPARPVLWLAAVAAGALAFRIHALGFYNDDYAWLELLAKAPAPGFLGRISHFLASNAGLWFRPLAPALYSALFGAFGMRELPYHLVYLGLDYAIAWNVLRWLEEEGAPPPQAFSAAVLTLLYPNHDATRHWLAAAGAPVGLALTLLSLRLYRRWERGAASPCLAGALACFAAAGLVYESSVLLAFVPPLLAWLDGGRTAAAARRGARKSAPLLAALAALILYQRALVPAWLQPERHAVSVRPSHILQVLSTGFECTFLNRLAHVTAKNALAAAQASSAAPRALFALLAAGLAWLCARLAREPGPAWPRLPVLAAAFFLLGYAPYFFDASYTPAVFSEINRTNLVASVGGALLLTWLLARLAAARPRAAGTAFAAVAVAFMAADWGSNAQWARASLLQSQTLADLQARLPAPDGPIRVLLFGGPTTIASATVFQSAYDFDSALRLRLGRDDLHGTVAEGRTRFEPDAAVVSWFGDARLSYQGLYAFDRVGKSLARIADRAAGERFLAELPR